MVRNKVKLQMLQQEIPSQRIKWMLKQEKKYKI